MGKPTPPAAPNPATVAGQQTAADISTAVANSWLGNANEQNPYGSVQYTGGTAQNVKVLDANGEEHQISVPTFNRNVTLNTAQQGLLDQQNQLGSSLNNLAINQTNKVGDILSSPVSADGLPAQIGSVTAPTLQNTNSAGTNAQISNVGTQAPIQTGVSLSSSPTSFSAGGPIQSSIGPTDYAAQRQSVEDAINSRLNPQLDRQNAALETKLVNQGLVRGTTAFNTAMDESNRQANDAHMQAILAGGQEQTRLADLALQSGNFTNAAQQQGYNENQGQGLFNLQATNQNNQNAINAGNFANTAQQQGYTQNMGVADFNNQAAQQRLANTVADTTFANQNAQAGFGNQVQAGNYQNTARQQGLQEQLSLRNQPLNEISALMSGGQVTVPQFQQYNPGTIANSQLSNDIYGSAAINQQNYQTQQSGTNALLGALGGLGGAGLYGLAKSDRRLKRDIKETGIRLLNGLMLYSFKYLWSSAEQIGVMADEVRRVMPAAVFKVGGFDAVDYRMILRAR